MPNSRRTAMTLLMAAIACASPLRAATQDTKDDGAREATTKYKVRTSFQTDARAARAAGQRVPKFHIAGPSRFALGGYRGVSPAGASAARGYTEAELAEIRAAQIRLVRNLTAGPYADPGGGVLSHPTLGRIVVSNTGATPTDPKAPRTRISMPNPGLLFGPSAVAGSIDPVSEEADTPGDPSKSAGGDPADFPVLVPGSGFAGPTAQPPAVGNEHLRGYDAKAIARWDVVPYQDFDGLFHIGVVAFHMNGIDRVEFSVEGGPWTPVTEMQLNPRTDVWEYTATLDASLFEDGLVEVRARVFPMGAGEVRVLSGNDLQVRHGEHSLFLHADASGVMAERISWVDPIRGNDDNDGLTQLSAKKTIAGGLRALDSAFGAIDGGTVYLLEGTHDWDSRIGSLPDVNTAMVTIAAAPGLEPEQVVLGGVDAIDGRELRVNMIHVKGLKLEQSPRDTTSALSPSQLWLEGCVTQGTGLTSLHSIPSAAQWQLGLYITDTQISNARVGVKTDARFIRNITASRLGEDAFTNVQMILNSSASELVQGDPSYHNDVVQYYGQFENTIVYGLEAIDQQAQMIFSRGPEHHDNAAFVNILIEGGHRGTGLMGQWIRTSNHVLFWNTTLVGTPFNFRSQDPSGGSRPVVNLSVRNSVFDTMYYPGSGYPEPDLAFENNHFLNSDPRGTGATSGGSYASLFMNPDANDFVPRAGGTLDGRILHPLTPADSRNQPVRSGGSIGSIQPDAGRSAGD